MAGLRTANTGVDATHFDTLFQQRLSQLFADAPGSVSVFSGYRSPERQGQLYQQALKKYGSEAEARKHVAPPGKSNHGRGTAADLQYANDAVKQWVHQNASRYGLSFPMSYEPWHIEPVEARGGKTGSTGGTAVASRSVRNNNPGNITYGDFARKLGATGSDGRFAIFPDAATGAKAMESLLFGPNYAGKGFTLSQAIHKWAPGSDNNNPRSYSATVAKAAGIPETARLSTLNPQQRSAVLRAMAGVEGGQGSFSSTFSAGRGGTAGPGTSPNAFAGGAGALTLPPPRQQSSSAGAYPGFGGGSSIGRIPVQVDIPGVSWEQVQQALGAPPQGNLNADELTQRALQLAERPVDFPDPMDTYRQLELMNTARLERAKAMNREQLGTAQAGSDEISAAIAAAGKGFGADATLAGLGASGRSYMQTAADQALTRVTAAGEDELFQAAAQLFDTSLKAKSEYARDMPESRINALKAYTDIGKANLEADTRAYQEQANTMRSLISDWGQTGRTTATEEGSRMRANQDVEQQYQKQDFDSWMEGLKQSNSLDLESVKNDNAVGRQLQSQDAATRLEQLRAADAIDGKTYSDQLSRSARVDQETWKLYQLYSGLTGGDQAAAKAMAVKAAPMMADTKAAVDGFRPLSDAEEQTAGPEDFVKSLAFKTFYNPRSINGVAVGEDPKVGYNDATTLITQRARAMAEQEFVQQGRKPAGQALRSTSAKAGEKFYTTTDVSRRAGELQKSMITQYNNLTGFGLDETGRAQIEGMWRSVPVGIGVRGRNASGALATPAFPGRAPVTMGAPTNRAPAVFQPNGNRPGPDDALSSLQRILGGGR